MFEKIIHRGTLVTVIVLIVAVIGAIAAFRIPVQMIPDLDVRTISVRTTWPGATPQDVEKEILIEQEEYLRNLPNLSRISASASSGRSEIELDFPFGVDITDMLIRVNNALSQVPSYPENVDEPRIYANSFSSNAFMFFSVTPLPNNPRQLDMDLMTDFVMDNVRTRMSSVQGVSEVDIRGGAQRQIQIHVDPVRIAQRQISMLDIRQSIRNRNKDRSGGEIDAGKRQFLIRTIGRFSDVVALEELILKREGSSVIRLKDVAQIYMDHSEKSSNTLFNGQPNLFVMVRKEAGSNVIDIKEQMMKEVAAVNRDVLNPAGMRLNHVADDVRYVEESIDNVWQNLILGALLATAVMYLFLRSSRATLVGVMGIPICIIVSFLGLLLAERTINVISLAGIAFAIGMTLDNSIVVLESIELERRKGLSRLKAALQGVKQVWPAVFASTATTILVFLPVIFVVQEAGQLYSDIAIAVSAAILASMVVAITVLPTAAARLEFSSAAKEESGNKSGIRGLTLRIVNGLLESGRVRVITIVSAFAISAAIIFGLTPPAEYLPEGEEPKIFANMSPPPGYNLNTMEKIADEILEYFLPHLEHNLNNPDLPKPESDVPAMRYMNMFYTPARLGIITEPMETGDMDALMEAITNKFREYPGMRAFAARGSIITSNDGGTRSINLDISGPRLAEIYEVALAAYRRAEEVFEKPRIQSSPRSLTMAQPMVEIQPDWDRVAEQGMTADALGFTVSALTDGSYVDEFFLEDDKIDIYLYGSKGQNTALGDIAQLPIYTPAGTVLPLSSLVSIVETVDTNSVRRVNGRRTVTLNIIPPKQIPLETGVEMVRTELVQVMMQEGQIPAGVNISISGAADQLDATREALTSNYLVALVIIYLLLVAIFNHWGYPLLILTSIPLGVAGGIVGLWCLNAVGSVLPLIGLPSIHQSFDMISMLGFLILMGTVVNNPILVVHRSVSNLNEQGMSAVEAVKEAVEARLRPIAMSTITTLFGLAPLVLIPGAGTELYRGVGAVVMFGILGAALVTLTMLPALTVVVLQFVDSRQKQKMDGTLSGGSEV